MTNELANFCFTCRVDEIDPETGLCFHCDVNRAGYEPFLVDSIAETRFAALVKKGATERDAFIQARDERRKELRSCAAAGLTLTPIQRDEIAD